MESLTDELFDGALKIINEIEEMGGMTKAIMTGMPKYRIEESSARKQARIDGNVETIVGVNKYIAKDENPIEVLVVDNTTVRREQIARIEKLKANRDNAKVKKLLDELTEAAKDGKKNLLEISVECARARATLGEISSALEKVYGRYAPTSTVVKGAFKSESEKLDKVKSKVQETLKRVKDFNKKFGRNPRIYVAKMGQDGHDRGSKVVSSGFADLGFDVDVGPLFQTPEEAARVAVDNDVHVIGVSSLAAGHKTLVPALIQELKKIGGEKIMVIAGGVIPQQDYKFLYDSGVKFVFGPGTKILDCTNRVLDGLYEKA